MTKKKMKSKPPFGLGINLYNYANNLAGFIIHHEDINLKKINSLDYIELIIHENELGFTHEYRSHIHKIPLFKLHYVFNKQKQIVDAVLCL